MNLLTAPPGGANEQVEILLQNSTVRIERIISYAVNSPFWYDQEEDEWVSVLSGWGEIAFSDRILRLRAGDAMLIPKHKRHRVSSTSSPCIWLCVFFRSDEANSQPNAPL